MTAFRDIAFPELQQELHQTRRILERVPDGKFDWAPHAKSMKLGRLASHVAGLCSFAQIMIDQPDLDLAKGGSQPPDATDNAGLLALFDRTSSALLTALAAASDENLQESWTLSAGPHVIYTGPRYAAVRRLGMNHIVHHRAQLSVFLRLLDVPVPGLYGPSADER